MKLNFFRHCADQAKYGLKVSPDTVVQHGECVIQILSAIWEPGKIEPIGAIMAS